MVTEELGFRLSEDDDEYLLTDAFIMFFSFLGFGSVPIIVYLICALNSVDEGIISIITSVIIIISLFILGALKSSFSSISWIYSGMETLCVGCACAVIAYGVAILVAYLIVIPSTAIA
jgi:DNA damage-binding protein 1